METERVRKTGGLRRRAVKKEPKERFGPSSWLL
jgi:hypothetical protein